MWCNRRHHYPIEKEWTFGKCVICYQEQHQEGQEKHHGTHKQQPSKLRVLDVSGHGLDVSGHGGCEWTRRCEWTWFGCEWTWSGCE